MRYWLEVECLHRANSPEAKQYTEKIRGMLGINEPLATLSLWTGKESKIVLCTEDLEQAREWGDMLLVQKIAFSYWCGEYVFGGRIYEQVSPCTFGSVRA